MFQNQSLEETQNEFAAYCAGYCLGEDPNSYPVPIPEYHQDYSEEFIRGWKERMWDESIEF